MSPRMEKSGDSRRFRINPIELVIFSIVTLVFFNSAYQLFYDWKGFHPSVLAKRHTEMTAAEKGSRAPAATSPASQTFANLEVGCAPASAQNTQASKVRLSGALCGLTTGAPDTTQLDRVEISNPKTHAVATVFTDTGSKRFSTDYIPVLDGQNEMQLKFIYKGGRVSSHVVTIEKATQ